MVHCQRIAARSRSPSLATSSRIGNILWTAFVLCSQRVLGKSLKIRISQAENSMVLCGYSKSIALTLNGCGMPFGKKKLSKLTPNVPLDDVSFIRGLFDTDGSVYRKYGRYMQIQFKGANPELLEYVRESLTRLGFGPTAIRRDATKFRFFLSRQGEIDLFFHVINPGNPKHLRRFRTISRNRTFRPYRQYSELLVEHRVDQTL